MSRITFSRDNLRKLRERGVPEGKRQIEYRDSKESGLILVQYPNGRQVFYLSISYRKRRFKERLGDSDTLSILEIRAKVAELRAAIQRGDDPIATRKKSQMRFSELFEFYYEEYRAKKASISTDESKFRLHLGEHFGSKQIGAITRPMLEKYHALKAEQLTPATANRHLNLLKALFSYAVEKLEVLAKSPACGIKAFPEEQKDRKYFDKEELSRFLTALESESNLEARNMIRFILLTGCRRGTARGLLLENYDAKSGTLLVAMTKNKTGQRLVLSEPAKAIVEGQVAKYGNRGFVFRGMDLESRISCPSVVMKRVCRKAGLPESGVHLLRHSYSLLQMENGVSIFQLKKALNHKSLASTEVYADITDNKLRQINNDLANEIGL